jgi:hypothetical protein
VCFYVDEKDKCRVIKEENTTIHHIEIPLEQKDVVYQYYVKTGNDRSATCSFKSYPSAGNELRIAVIGDLAWYHGLDSSSLMSDMPHLLVTCGDNIPNQWEACGEGVKGCMESYQKMIDEYPALFSSVPFMPALGNHDNEIRKREKQPQTEATYDQDAMAFVNFFDLPGDEWKWNFDIPDFDVHLIALDLHHVYEYNQWKTCHDFSIHSTQYQWYKTLMDNHPKGYIITLYNECNRSMRSEADGIWRDLFEKGTTVISGCGGFAERSGEDEFPYFNTALYAGTLLPDQNSKFIQSVGNYILLRCTTDHPVQLEMKQHDGVILDSVALLKKQ